MQDTGTYLGSIAENEAKTEIYTVEDMLNDIENAELLKPLPSVDKLTLQISLLKMNGYSTNEIAVLVHLSMDAIYKRMGRFPSISLLPCDTGVCSASRACGAASAGQPRRYRLWICYAIERHFAGVRYKSLSPAEPRPQSRI